MKMSNESSFLVSFPLLLLVLSFLMASFFDTLGKSECATAETVELFKQKNIRRVRLYSPDGDVLAALRGSNIEVMLGLPNPDLESVATSQSNADNWVRTNVVNYVNDVNFRYISVGNEVHIGDSYARYLGPALENIDRAVVGAGLDGRIKVSTAVDMTVLDKDSHPPSKGSFRGEVMVLMEPIIRFLVNKKSPLHLNLYTYFSYAGNPNEIPLDYALLKPSVTVSDPPRSYQNLFDAMLDAVYSALEKSGGGSLDIVVSETGWPTSAGIETNVENARIYNNNVINHVKNGTPKRPGKEIETYLFAMYDENTKPTPPDVERFWGLFRPSKEPKYDVNFG